MEELFYLGNKDDYVQKLRIYKVSGGGEFIQTTLCCIVLFLYYSFVQLYSSETHKKTSELCFLSKHPCKFNIARPHTSQPVQFIFFAIFTLM